MAKLLELPILEEYLNNLRNKEEFLNIDLTTQVWWGTVANDCCLKLFHSQMIETIGRQLEDVVLGQRLFSDIEVCKNWPNCSTIIFIQILLLDSQSISFLSLFLEMVFFSSLPLTTEWFTLTSLCSWLAVTWCRCLISCTICQFARILYWNN